MVTLLNEFCIKKNVEISIDFIVISSEADLKKHKFIGSPSIRINNLDVDQNARTITDYGFS